MHHHYHGDGGYRQLNASYKIINASRARFRVSLNCCWQSFPRVSGSAAVFCGCFCCLRRLSFDTQDFGCNNGAAVSLDSVKGFFRFMKSNFLLRTRAFALALPQCHSSGTGISAGSPVCVVVGCRERRSRCRPATFTISTNQ